jgi:hypothetical protein
MAHLVRKTAIPYSGKVHDLTVSDSHTYNVESKAVHNSAGGSLLAYVLNITQMDPIKHGLLFERFMTRKKRCLLPTTYVMTNIGSCQLQNLAPEFHKVLTHTGEYKPVVSKVESEHQELIEVEAEDGTTITCSLNHLWVVVRDGRRMEVRADELQETDELIKLHFDERSVFEKL